MTYKQYALIKPIYKSRTLGSYPSCDTDFPFHLRYIMSAKIFAFTHQEFKVELPSERLSGHCLLLHMP